MTCLYSGVVALTSVEPLQAQGGLAAECAPTVKKASQGWVRTRRKQAPVAEPTARRSDWVGYNETYVEKLTVKRFVAR